MEAILRLKMPESCQECQFASEHPVENGALRCVALWNEGYEYDWGPAPGPTIVRPEPEKRHAGCPLVPVETEGAR